MQVNNDFNFYVKVGFDKYSQCLKDLNLNSYSEFSESFERMKTVVKNYSPRGQNFIVYAFYCIGQAFLSIFGYSEWQKAKNAMLKAEIKLINLPFKSSLDIQINSLAKLLRISSKNNLKIVLNTALIDLANKINNKFLELLVRVNNENPNIVGLARILLDETDLINDEIDFLKHKIPNISKDSLNEINNIILNLLDSLFKKPITTDMILDVIKNFPLEKLKPIISPQEFSAISSVVKSATKGSIELGMVHIFDNLLQEYKMFIPSEFVDYLNKISK